MRQKRVLIVDGDVTVLTALEHSFEYVLRDYQVVIAENGVVALTELQKQSFDLIVTDDDQTPGMNALDLARAAQQISPSTPIVWLTGESYQDVQARINLANLAGFLAKPFPTRQLYKQLPANVYH